MAGLGRSRRVAALEGRMLPGRRRKGRGTLKDHGPFGELVAQALQAWQTGEGHDGGKGFHRHQLMRAVSFALDALFSPELITYLQCRELEALFSATPTALYTYGWTPEKDPLALAVFDVLVSRGDLERYRHQGRLSRRGTHSL